MDEAMGSIQLTKITSKNPARLSKGFSLGEKGELVKTPGGSMLWGHADRLSLQGIEDLALELQKLKPAQAFCYGVSIHDRAKIVMKNVLDEARSKRNGGREIISRTREFFGWPEGQGVLMFDYDPPEGTPPMTRGDFLQAVYSIAPEIADAPHMLTASCSSFIFNGEKQLIGPKGWRLLVIVARGTDIPRVGADFVKRCWLQSQGYIAISKAGAYLERALVDDSVWQPERLDFCGGAFCKAPLSQKRPKLEVFNPDAEPMDTTEGIRALSLGEEEEVLNIIKQAKADAEPEAREIRDIWITERLEQGLKDVPEKDRKQKERTLRETLNRAVNGMELLGDFILYPEKGKTVTVAEALDDPDQWHGHRFADPLEPDYKNDRRIAYLNLRAAGRPYLFSHAHGGRRFSLRTARHEIKIWPGERVATVRKTLGIMKQNRTHFRRGSEIVTVAPDGFILPRNEKDLLFDCDGLANWKKYDARAKDFILTDCKPSIPAGVQAARAEWGLPELVGVATAPLLDPRTLRLIETDGFDETSGLMLILNDTTYWPGVKNEPDDHDVKNALKTLWQPLSLFPFDGPVSKGVMLSAVLTNAIRPLISTAPGYAFDAPCAGSGKTLIAKFLSELAGVTPAMIPHASDPEEIRKRLLALLRQGSRVCVLDNVTGPLDSPALCACLTAEIYSDRILGVSETLTVPTRTLFLITGNNLNLRGDLCRRVLTCRIDPGVETPWKRRFDFDPVQDARAFRFELVAAALTVLKAGILNGPKMTDRTASFELWSDTIRKTVIWIGEKNFQIDEKSFEVADPVDSIDTAYEMDPETQKLSALLGAWWAVFEADKKTVGEVIAFAKADSIDAAEGTLFAAVDEIAGERGGTLNPRRFGRWIERQRGRIIDGMSFHSAGKKARARVWHIKKQAKK